LKRRCTSHQQPHRRAPRCRLAAASSCLPSTTTLISHLISVPRAPHFTSPHPHSPAPGSLRAPCCCPRLPLVCLLCSLSRAAPPLGASRVPPAALGLGPAVSPAPPMPPPAPSPPPAAQHTSPPQHHQHLHHHQHHHRRPRLSPPRSRAASHTPSATQRCAPACSSAMEARPVCLHAVAP
jgi:hypothetical protein